MGLGTKGFYVYSCPTLSNLSTHQSISAPFSKTGVNSSGTIRNAQFSFACRGAGAVSLNVHLFCSLYAR